MKPASRKISSDKQFGGRERVKREECLIFFPRKRLDSGRKSSGEEGKGKGKRKGKSKGKGKGKGKRERVKGGKA